MERSHTSARTVILHFYEQAILEFILEDIYPLLSNQNMMHWDPIMLNVENVISVSTQKAQEDMKLGFMEKCHAYSGRVHYQYR